MAVCRSLRPAAWILEGIRTWTSSGRQDLLQAAVGEEVAVRAVRAAFADHGMDAECATACCTRVPFLLDPVAALRRRAVGGTCGRSPPSCGLLDRMRSVLGVLWLLVCVFVTCTSAPQSAEADALAGMA